MKLRTSKEVFNFIGNKFSIGVCNATLALEAFTRFEY